MIINNNISSLIASNAISKNEKAMNGSIEKLSSGLRINKAADDAAGLAVSEKMRSQIRSLEVAKRNIQDGISLVQTAEGAMDEVHNMLQRLRELNVQALNGIYTADDKANLNAEAKQLVQQINEIANKTNFNGINLLNAGADVDLQTGIDAGDKITITAIDVKAATILGIDLEADPDNIDNVNISAVGFLATLDTAIQTVATNRATLGAIQNRLEHTLSNVTNYHENLTASESAIRDVDMAKEMANYSSKQVLLQAGMSIASQANQKTQMITKLLG